MITPPIAAFEWHSSLPGSGSCHSKKPFPPPHLLSHSRTLTAPSFRPSSPQGISSVLVPSSLFASGANPLSLPRTWPQSNSASRGWHIWPRPLPLARLSLGPSSPRRQGPMACSPGLMPIQVPLPLPPLQQLPPPPSTATAAPAAPVPGSALSLASLIALSPPQTRCKKRKTGMQPHDPTLNDSP